MKKLLLILFALVLCLGVLAACDEPTEPPKGEEPHKHTYSDAWSYNNVEHWHACTGTNCTEKADTAAHAPDASGHCTTCGYLPETDPSIFTFEEVEGGYEIEKYIGSATVVIIPSTYNGEPVISIGNSAFSGCTSLTSIVIPDSITSIGNYAFDQCTNLISMTLGDNSQLASVGICAFRYCENLTNIYIPDNVTSIGDAAFLSCLNLTTIKLPEGIESIGVQTFDKCRNLISIELPAGITSIGEKAFFYCSSLTSVTFGEKSLLTSIGEYAFSYTSLTSIEIPDSMTSIGNSAFSSCTSLTSIEIPDSVTSIGNSAFSGCTSLTSIEIPDSVTSIGNSAFSACTSLTRIEIPDGVTSISDSAFFKCTSLASVIFGENSQLTNIETFAFSSCTSLLSIEIPGRVISVSAYAFNDCTNLGCIRVAAGNAAYHSVGDCLVETATKTLILGCKNSVIPKDGSVTSIGISAFWGCTSLTSIEIPDSITIIESSAFFSFSTSLEAIYYGGTADDWSKISIGSNNYSITEAIRYYYSETQPSEAGNYWHYVNGVPTVW